MEHIHREAQGGSDKRERYLGSKHKFQTRGRESYDRPCQRFHHGQSSWRVQVASPVFEEGPHQHINPSMSYNLRLSNSLPSFRDQVTIGHLDFGFYYCGSPDYWSRE